MKKDGHFVHQLRFPSGEQLAHCYRQFEFIQTMTFPFENYMVEFVALTTRFTLPKRPALQINATLYTVIF